MNSRVKLKIKTGDTVRILTGKDKGKQGKVIQTFPALCKVVVEGMNVAVRHLRGRGNQPGQKVTFPAPMHVSNVQAVHPKTGMVGRVGWKVETREGKLLKVRVLRRKGTTEDLV
ncbi:MAG TPA: 50S ribosomal protein L24 [Patescibacteria group bacterium]|nr:50S ribosomal protein L24 [Patescibacteria group bacterium]